MTSKLDWTTAGLYVMASTRQRNKVGVVFWRIRKLTSGRWDVTDSTPFALGDSGLERWPMFETIEAAKLWCQQQNTALTD